MAYRKNTVKRAYVPRRRTRQRGLSGLWALLVFPLVLGFIYVLYARTETPIDATGPESGYELPTEDCFYPERQEQPVENDQNPSGNVISVNSQSIDIPLIPMSLRYIDSTGYMALVNRQHPVLLKPSSYQLMGVWPTVAVSRVDGMYLHESALRAVSEMFASARQAGMSDFFVSSGFRSYADQVQLYGDGSNSAFVQPPGHSEHHTGLAADILVMGIGMMEMADTTEGRWLADNSYRYGLILRYPEGAMDITGIAFEPWHFRYVGRVHAYYMKRNNFVLEEYLQYIRQHGHFYFNKNGVTYHVLYQVPYDGMIYVPDGPEFIVSKDNKGGYIVWTTIS